MSELDESGCEPRAGTATADPADGDPGGRHMGHAGDRVAADHPAGPEVLRYIEGTYAAMMTALKSAMSLCLRCTPGRTAVGGTWVSGESRCAIGLATCLGMRA